MTIYDISREANVSIATVSRVLNNPEAVSEKTRKHVLAVMKRVNYVPNAMARGLVNERTNTVGILVNDIQHQVFASTIYYLEQALSAQGYSTLLCTIGNDVNKIPQYLYILSSKKIDALVLVGSFFASEEVEQLLSQYFPTLPIVLSDTAMPELQNAHSILEDHVQAMRSSVSFLRERGRREIAFVYAKRSFNTDRKISAFFEAMEALLPEGSFDRDSNLIELPFDNESGCHIVDVLKGNPRKIDALIFSNDNMAILAINDLKRCGYRIPEDYAIIAYDNSAYALCSDPTITSLDIQTRAKANIIANTVSDLLSLRPVGSTIVLQPRLIPRNST